MEAWQSGNIIKLVSFIVGCSCGSFINVIIHRFPLNQSIVYPRSYCPKCKSKISWLENIPIISWLILRGECKYCGCRISIQYPIIETLCGILFTANVYLLPRDVNIFSATILLIAGWFFLSHIIALSLIDIKHYWLPQSLCFTGLISGLVFTVLSQSQINSINATTPIIEHILAAFLGYLSFAILGKVALRIYGKPALGHGDAKLSALLGSWLGISGVFITIWLSFYLAGLFVTIGLISKKLYLSEIIPFGPFLGLSGIAVWFLGNNLCFRFLTFNLY